MYGNMTVSVQDKKNFLEVLWGESKYTKYAENFTEFLEDPHLHSAVNEFEGLADELLKRAKRCGNYALKSCNYGLTENQERLDAANDSAMVELAKTLGVSLEIQGDPRGNTVKLKTPKTGRFNNPLGGREVGWGVPGS